VPTHEYADEQDERDHDHAPLYRPRHVFALARQYRLTGLVAWRHLLPGRDVRHLGWVRVVDGPDVMAGRARVVVDPGVLARGVKMSRRRLAAGRTRLDRHWDRQHTSAVEDVPIPIDARTVRRQLLGLATDCARGATRGSDEGSASATAAARRTRHDHPDGIPEAVGAAGARHAVRTVLGGDLPCEVRGQR